VELRGIEPLT